MDRSLVGSAFPKTGGKKIAFKALRLEFRVYAVARGGAAMNFYRED